MEDVVDVDGGSSDDGYYRYRYHRDNNNDDDSVHFDDDDDADDEELEYDVDALLYEELAKSYYDLLKKRDNDDVGHDSSARSDKIKRALIEEYLLDSLLHNEENDEDEGGGEGTLLHNADATGKKHRSTTTTSTANDNDEATRRSGGGGGVEFSSGRVLSLLVATMVMLALLLLMRRKGRAKIRSLLLFAQKLDNKEKLRKAIIEELLANEEEGERQQQKKTNKKSRSNGRIKHNKKEKNNRNQKTFISTKKNNHTTVANNNNEETQRDEKQPQVPIPSSSEREDADDDHKNKVGDNGINFLNKEVLVDDNDNDYQYIRQKEEEQERKILQQVLEISLRETSLSSSSPSSDRRKKQSYAENHPPPQLRKQKEREEVQKLEAEQAEKRKRDADEARLQKQRELEAQRSKLTKRKKREAEYAKMKKQQEDKAELVTRQAERREYWVREIQSQQAVIGKIKLLLAAEVCSRCLCNDNVHSHLGNNASTRPWSSLLDKQDANKKLKDQARQTFRKLYEDRIRRRVIVVIGSTPLQQDISQYDGRTGTIQDWDESKGKFLVGFPTSKKGKGIQSIYLLPEYLEPLPPVCKKQTVVKEQKDCVSIAHMPSFHDNSENNEDGVCVYKIEKITVDELLEVKDVDSYLDLLFEQRRDEMLRVRQKQQEELTKQHMDKLRAFWSEKIQFESDTVGKLTQLLAAEFCRKIGASSQLREKLMNNHEVKEKLKTQAKQTFLDLYPGHFPDQIIVKENTAQQQDFNGRTGTFLGWDDNKAKVKVGFETKKKKGKNLHEAYIFPEFAEALPTRRTSKKKNVKKLVSFVFIPSLYKEADLMYEVQRTTVDDMLQADSVTAFLDAFNDKRDEDDRQAMQQEVERERAEEEARRRRAEKFAREEEEWWRRKEDFRQRKHRLNEMHQRRKRAQREACSAAHQEDSSGIDHNLHSCSCPDCTMEREFAHRLFDEFFRNSRRGHGSSSSFFFGSGGSFFFMDNNDDDSDDYFEDDDARWDEEFDRLHEEKLAKKNAKAADLLGIEEDASEDEINRAFRKLSLRFHPDKFRPENHEQGTTKDDAEEHFKQLSDARDTMLNFIEQAR